MSTSRREFLEVTLAAAGAARLAGAAPLTAGSSPAVTRSRASMRILILGGTGFIGPYQVRYARERGHTLTLFNRGRTNPDLFPGVETLHGDRDGQLDALRGREWDAVIDNSGFFPRHVRDSARLLEGAVGRYLFVSSISAYDLAGLEVGHDEFTAPKATMADPADESGGPYGPSYGARKALCEREVVEAFGEDRAVVVRPGAITGRGDPTDRVRHWLARLDRGGEILAPGNPADPVQIIDAADLSSWIVRLLEQGDAGPYNAVGPASRLSIAELVYGFRALFGNPVRFTWVDEAFLAAQGVPGGAYMPWLPSQAQALMQIANARALATGLTFRPLAETGTDMLAELRETTADERASLGVAGGGVPWEREAELLAAWRARGG